MCSRASSRVIGSKSPVGVVVLVEAGTVLDELEQRDVGLVGRYVGKHAAERRVELERAVLRELENGGRREVLQDGAHVERGFHGVGRITLAIGEAVGLGRELYAPAS